VNKPILGFPRDKSKKKSEESIHYSTAKKHSKFQFMFYKIYLKVKFTTYLNKKYKSQAVETRMESKIELILKALSDGQWHKTDELRQLTELDDQQIQEMAAFLFEYDLAKVDLENKKVRINQYFQDFLTEPTSP
jgi:hypothetical protein